MDWDDLQYVLAVTRAGTLSGAAEELGVARTTVGRRIDALEASLAAKLFARTPDGFVPTAAGDDLARVAARIESDVLAAEGRVLGQDAELSGGLRVATLDFVFQGYVSVFRSFADRYPGVELTVCTGYKNVSLKRREADVAIRLGPSPGDHLVGRALGELEFGLYVHRSLADEGGTDLDLNALPYLRPDERNADPVMEQWMATHAPDARTVMRFDTYPVLRTAVRAGVGAHMMFCMDGDADTDLIRVEAELPMTKMMLWVLTLPELTTNSRVRAFMDHVYDELRL